MHHTQRRAVRVGGRQHSVCAGCQGPMEGPPRKPPPTGELERILLLAPPVLVLMSSLTLRLCPDCARLASARGATPGRVLLGDLPVRSRVPRHVLPCAAATGRPEGSAGGKVPAKTRGHERAAGRGEGARIVVSSAWQGRGRSAFGREGMISGRPCTFAGMHCVSPSEGEGGVDEEGGKEASRWRGGGRPRSETSVFLARGGGRWRT
jgi:hypothetical protein